MSNFITNSQDGKTLKNRISKLVKGSEELKFLVGFFYFSGLQELYESLKDNNNVKVKILVGLQVDILLNKVNEIADFSENTSDDDKIDMFFESLEKAINNDESDNSSFYEQVEFFIKLIEEDKLTIRKTFEPNHAKLYILKLAGQLKEIIGAEFITGSSNLTRAGLKNQNEFNVEIRDYGLKEAEEYFDDLWDNAIEITEDDVNKRNLLDFMKNKSQIATVTPFEAYALVLKTYLNLQQQKELKPIIFKLLEKNGYKKYSYQLDAVKQALTIINEYNGVIIADVVGLGKSVIASLIAKSLNKRGLILAPPGLIGNKTINSGWHGYLSDFKLYDWDVMSVGNLEAVNDYLKYNEDIEVVIVDEAHRFRNQDTSSYELLSAITKNKKVILLTATPFNNNPNDVFSLLKLFILPGKSSITLDENLESKFSKFHGEFARLSYIIKHLNSSKVKNRERALKYYNDMIEEGFIDISLVNKKTKKLANEIKTMISPIIIRRNRIDLKSDFQYKKEIKNLSEVRDPEEILYDLSEEQFEFYDKIINDYFSENGLFTGAMYQPFLYETKIKTSELEKDKNSIYWQQKNLFDFMRRLLIKRFESSFGAFYKTIENFIKTHEIVLKFIDKSNGKYILDRKLIEKIYEDDSEAIEVALVEFAEKLDKNEVRKNDKIYDINKFVGNNFIKNIENDKTLFELLKERIDELKLKSNDPKRKKVLLELEAIIKDKQKNEPNRKIIIFTEFKDTVTHIKNGIKDQSRFLFVDKDLNKKLLNDLYSNFDASYKKEQKNDYDIIVTTDKLSEGFNLNRAGAIINYDIPWNPTRVIQRLGRINRIGEKLFDELIIRNIFPTKEGNDIVKSREIAMQKMFLIHNILGEDSKIFDIDEIPTASELYKRMNTNPEENEEENIITTIRNRFEEIKKIYPDLIKRINKLPYRVKSSKKYKKDELIVIRKKALNLFTQTVVDNKVIELSLHELLNSIECKFEEKKLDLTKSFWDDYEKIKSHKSRRNKSKKEVSIEQKAFNNLQSGIKFFRNDLEELIPFIKVLIDDIKKYHILPKYTLRRIQEHELSPKAKEKVVKSFINEINFIKNSFGEDYLDIMLENAKTHEKEIIITIENQKIPKM
jgi:superfamily II DNA or RNA helicase